MKMQIAETVWTYKMKIFGRPNSLDNLDDMPNFIDSRVKVSLQGFRQLGFYPAVGVIEENDGGVVFFRNPMYLNNYNIYNKYHQTQNQRWLD